jgi:hypothetical protein
VHEAIDAGVVDVEGHAEHVNGLRELLALESREALGIQEVGRLAAHCHHQVQLTEKMDARLNEQVLLTGVQHG